MSIPYRLSVPLVAAAFIVSPAASAFPFLTNFATGETSVSGGGQNDTDRDSTDNRFDPDVATKSFVGNNAGMGRASVSSVLTDVSPNELRLDAFSEVGITRNVSPAFGGFSGFARLKPAQQVRFRAPEDFLTLDYSAFGTISIENEMQANNSFVNFSIRVFNATTGQVLFEISRSNPNAGYDVMDSITFGGVNEGDLIDVSIDNGASAFIGGAETEADLRSDLTLLFLVPEPGTAGLLSLAGLMLLRRRIA